MFKIAAFVSLMLIGNIHHYNSVLVLYINRKPLNIYEAYSKWSLLAAGKFFTANEIFVEFAGNLLAGGLSCDSCGNECASACGTRHFRSCCFNYLRRKRGPEAVKFTPQRVYDYKMDKYQKPAFPMLLLEEVPEQLLNFLDSSDLRPYYVEDTVDSRFQAYDA